LEVHLLSFYWKIFEFSRDKLKAEELPCNAVFEPNLYDLEVEKRNY